MLRLLGGGCQAPVGALGSVDAAGGLTLRTVVFPADGGPPRRAEAHGEARHATAVARDAVERLGMFGHEENQGSASPDSASETTAGTGVCWLVGAGPGDLGLVTLRAKECVEQADVVVYDYLCNPAMLAWARGDAELIYAGKKSGQHTLPQGRHQ